MKNYYTEEEFKELKERFLRQYHRLSDDCIREFASEEITFEWLGGYPIVCVNSIYFDTLFLHRTDDDLYEMARKLMTAQRILHFYKLKFEQ